MIRSDIFQQIRDIWGESSVDLFASRLNRQVSCYVSWKPDPGAAFIGAFSITWSKHFFLCFPPFQYNCKMSTEDTDGLCVRIDDSSNVTNPKLAC